MTKSVHSQYSNYEGAMPAMTGWATDRQTFEWAVPYHDAAIKYWKEAGVWTNEMQAHNDNLIKRQGVLAAAWQTMAAKNISDDEAYQKGWMEVRAAELEKAGFNPIWK